MPDASKGYTAPATLKQFMDLYLSKLDMDHRLIVLADDLRLMGITDAQIEAAMRIVERDREVSIRGGL